MRKEGREDEGDMQVTRASVRILEDIRVKERTKDMQSDERKWEGLDKEG